MKDDKLEKEFEEYFKGVNTPDDITRDAKRYVKPRRNLMPKIVKFASVAASIVLVFAVTLTIIFKADFKKNESDETVGNNSSLGNNTPSSPDFSDNNNTGFAFYTDGDLELSDANAYTLSSLDKSLKLIENFALADNASVNTCKAGYSKGKLALVKAEVSISNGLNRDETQIFVEFTDDKLIYSGLDGYYEGRREYFRGVYYYLTETVGENGEPEFKLYISYRGVKYYFKVNSSDKKAYEKYLDLVINGNF